MQRFGKYLKDVPPGLHFNLPLGVDVATIAPVKRQLKQEFGFATAGAIDPYQISADAKQETQTERVTRTPHWWSGWFNTVFRIPLNSFARHKDGL